MSRLQSLVSHIPLPGMIEVRHHHRAPHLESVSDAVVQSISGAGVLSRIRPGDRIAITAGSRGIANIPVILREIVRLVRAAGGEPFLVPAMGSHGGSTAEGQLEVLKGMGVTESFCECPIHSSMETDLLGYTEANGLPVYFDHIAHQADGIILVGRIKPHPAFRGRIGSGLLKMAVIGLGKQKGASYCHQMGIHLMAERVFEIGSYILEKEKVLFGVGLIENCIEETAEIHTLPAEEIPLREPELMQQAAGYKAKLFTDHYDVLVVDEVGKDISGPGMDTDLIGRYTNEHIPPAHYQQVVVALRLTEGTHGNASGMGLIDIATQRLHDTIDFTQSYANILTSRVLLSGKMPMILDDDRTAIQGAINCCFAIDVAKPKIIRLKNTLAIDRYLISEALLEQALCHPDIEIPDPTPRPMVFDETGHLFGEHPVW